MSQIQDIQRRRVINGAFYILYMILVFSTKIDYELMILTIIIVGLIVILKG
jgi:hypothetical protein